MDATDEGLLWGGPQEGDGEPRSGGARRAPITIIPRGFDATEPGDGEVRGDMPALPTGVDFENTIPGIAPLTAEAAKAVLGKVEPEGGRVQPASSDLSPIERAQRLVVDGTM